MENKQNSFMFYENFLEAIEQLPESERANACYQLCRYALNDELPADKSLAMFCIGVKYSVHKYQGRGGNHNPTGKNQYSGQSGQTGQNGQTGQKPIQTQTETETKTEIYNNIDEKNQKDIQIENQDEKKAKVHNMLEICGNAFKATDAVVGVFDRPDGTTREGIRIKNPRLMAFVRQRFDREVLNKVSDWAIDHNQRGHTYNATALLKLLCKFQSNVEPDINFNHVQSEYLTFEYKGE